MPPTAEAPHRAMGLTDEEYSLIVQGLGREPNLVELGMYAVMWSEHCSYKSSRNVLSYFGEYRKALEGEGLENAGVVDIGDGWGVVLKVESHNHPSAVEPYQGAATGVGGIIRDILSMGARPVALLNSLRFGPLQGALESERNRHLVEHVVEAIGGYGNCIGIPTVGGEVDFHPCYSGNPLVNAMCVGVVRLDSVATAAASGVGNPVLYLGSATGKDGIHGATFASDVLDEDSEQRRPNVQIGDPFAGKQLIEATLEALATGAVQSIQDMGAAGLTCSTTEMAAKGGVGMDVDLDKVPFRDQDTTAYEAMLSESQERMLAVAHRGREGEVLSLFRKWGACAEVVGEVTDTGRVRIFRHGRLEADLDPLPLAEDCPLAPRRAKEPEWFAASAAWRPPIGTGPSAEEALALLLMNPGVGSKRWVYEQYDRQVMAQTIAASGAAEAAVVAPRGTGLGLAISLDGNSRWVAADPYVGGTLAVAEAVRNVACTGARPLAATDGLNYGDPRDPEVYWAFERSVRGVADAAEALGTPVVSGNVSFYNETEEGAIRPTPMIGIVGVLQNPAEAVGSSWAAQDASLMLLGTWPEDEGQGLGASRYVEAILAKPGGRPCPTQWDAERRLVTALVEMAEARCLMASKDVSDGGLVVALAECAIGNMVGARIVLDCAPGAYCAESVLFGEFPGLVVVQTADPAQVSEIAHRAGVGAAAIGATETSGSRLEVVRDGETLLDSPVEPLRTAYEGTIPAFFLP
ncbi:MAG: phosphoribosylformylglycinamidine synthase subunit PurL [Fimbriimonadaceae bacterium]|nr:phosphoribosylformylglycinamidine synthase subunit PurL [Fimbriimonadaceae bacterium]